MLKRMQVLEEKGTEFATRPLRSLPVIGALDGASIRTAMKSMFLYLYLYSESVDSCPLD